MYKSRCQYKKAAAARLSSNFTKSKKTYETKQLTIIQEYQKPQIKMPTTDGRPYRKETKTTTRTTEYHHDQTLTTTTESKTVETVRRHSSGRLTPGWGGWSSDPSAVGQQSSTRLSFNPSLRSTGTSDLRGLRPSTAMSSARHHSSSIDVSTAASAADRQSSPFWEPVSSSGPRPESSPSDGLRHSFGL